MENQEERAAKKEAGESWRKCPICAQEFQDFLPAIKHLEEHLRRESQMVNIELGARDYLTNEDGTGILPSPPGIRNWQEARPASARGIEEEVCGRGERLAIRGCRLARARLNDGC